PSYLAGFPLDRACPRQKATTSAPPRVAGVRDGVSTAAARPSPLEPAAPDLRGELHPPPDRNKRHQARIGTNDARHRDVAIPERSRMVMPLPPAQQRPPDGADHWRAQLDQRSLLRAT